jgi:adenylate cyclase
MSADLLFGPDEGWALAPVAAWLYTEGRRIGDPLRMVEALAAHLNSAGAHIDRMAVMSRTLHPQLVGWSVFWSRQNGVRRDSIQHGVRSSDAYVGSPIQQVQEHQATVRIRVGAQPAEGEHALVQDLRDEHLTDYVAMPMISGVGTVHAITLATAAPGGFTDADLARFAALSNLLAPLVEIAALRRTALGLLDTFVGPRISERILAGQVKRGDGDRIDAAFWYSDLRGFTGLSESLPTGELLHLLNDYFEFCAAASSARGGEILQFIGDAILIVFEIRDQGERAAVCESALDAAIDAFASIAVVNHRRRRAGQALIEFGLGLHVGTVTHANVGAPDRLAFNVVGPAVNMTARIQSMTKEIGVPLLLSGEFAGLVKRPLRSVGRHDLRGVASAQELFTPAEEDAAPPRGDAH